MKLLYIGAGFVGACSAAVAADSGHSVLVFDIDKNRVELLGSGDRDTIESCLFEKGLGDILIRNQGAIKFTADYGDVTGWVDEVDAVFMCVNTPELEGGTGELNLKYYNLAAEKITQALAVRNNGKQERHVVIVNKSTLPIAMVDSLEKILLNNGVKNCGVVSNPEFLVEGKAIEGSLKPDRIVIGARSQKDFEVMRGVYQRFYNSPTSKYLEVSPEEAEAGKLLANYLLLSRLADTYTVIGRVAEKFPNITFENLRKILVGDERFGQWGFFDSIFAGGSCLIKDTSSLLHQLEKTGAEIDRLKATLKSNYSQLESFYSRIDVDAKTTYKDKVVAICGVAFKRDTNDVRNSGAVEIVKRLIADGAKEIRVYDPAAMPMFKLAFDQKNNSDYRKIVCCESEAEALSASDICMILADWPKFRTLDEVIKKVRPAPYLIMDGRRMLVAQFGELQKMGYDIIAVGSPFIKGKKSK